MQQSQPSRESRLQFLDYWRVVKTRKAIVFAVFLLVLLTAATVTYFQPKIYAGIARIKVEQERPSVAVFQQQMLPSYDPYFLQTQYEIIQSQKILYPVIEQEKLLKVWADRHQALPNASIDMALQRLKNQIAVRRFRDTSLIEITVYDEDPRLAATIANSITEVFEKDRLEVKRHQVLRGLDKLREELALQQGRVQAAQTKVEQLRKELGVPLVGGTENAVKLSDVTLNQLELQLTTARVEAVAREARVAELKKLSALQLRNAIATIITDPNVQQLLQNFTDIETNLERLKEDYGPDHPVVRATIATRDKLREQLDTRLEGILRGFEVEYQMAQARVTEIQRQLDEAKKVSLTMEGDRYLPFRNARREEESETKLYEVLKQRLAQETTDMEMPRSPVEVIDHAEPLFIPVRPRMWLNLSLGAIIGLVLGVGVAFFLEYLDTSIKTVQDIEQYLGLPVLGVVSHQAKLLCRGEASPGEIEVYRMLRTNVEFTKGNGAIKSLCVLSAGAGEGKSYTTANLAYTYAQQGARVLVVDSDLRRPSVHKYLELPNDFGLADYLTSSKGVDEIVQGTKVDNVWAITSGTSTRASLPLLTSHRMEQLIQEVGRRFDVVLYDTPPVLGVSDAAVMAREVGMALLVIQDRRYPRAMSLRALQVIERAGGKLLGVVVNNVTLSQDDTYYYYHGHYGYYDQQTPPQPAAPAAAPVATPAAPKKADGDEIELQGKY